MNKDPVVAHYLLQHEHSLQQMGCLEVPSLPRPTLRNDIHRIFRLDSWMRGYGQGTERFYTRMKPALRLASLMITESCMLPWFTHLCHGKRVRVEGTHDSKGYVYLEPRRPSREGIEEVRRALRDLAEVVVFMFVPERYSEGKWKNSWGTSAVCWRKWPWSRRFRAVDYPFMSRAAVRFEGEGHGLPEIALNREFARFFDSGYEECTSSEQYRVMYMFAVTLVHELAHAFWMFIGRGGSPPGTGEEPRWHKEELRAELGYSWETITMGRIVEPVLGVYGMLKRPCALVSLRTEAWAAGQPEPRAVRALIDTVSMRMKKVENWRGVFFGRPVDGGRGTEWFVGTSMSSKHKNCVSVIHAIPLRWIAQWFSECEWRNRREVWRAHRLIHGCNIAEGRPYDPPGLGPTFMMVHLRLANKEPQLWVSSIVQDDPNIDWERMATKAVSVYDGF
ncbi:hypothetical protein BU24DRAFT_421111 [Aaosphaeria arxii CBS 175.79]|uniref:Uncharacterized protein n=1 Tax=Aaosphaeria arxii CBS 175.79 TaxID=1450172 RepID=A0A6A5XXS3_9PLEO|nr:uncharacterized protein BU24DRAFT_421111 [Aaosphaeria arxii CBS 175.79]KAF2018108.1 hypothetical protein BU24DRAFT_421111 [Aaosphaeria arxii CBS 175.79]